MIKLTKTDTSSVVRRVALCEVGVGETAEFFAAVTARDKRMTKGKPPKPYYHLEFCDRKRRVAARVWCDSETFEQCDRAWTVGMHLFVHARHDPEWNQMTVLTARPVRDQDRKEGYDPGLLVPSTRFNVDEMFDEIVEIARKIGDEPLRDLVMYLLTKNEEKFKLHPAAERAHHAYRGGLLEHTLSVAQNGLMLIEKYRKYYEDFNPPLNKDLVVAGCILHDIGKLVELESTGDVIHYTKPGILVGHIIVGRDMVRDAAREVGGLDPELLLMLEHIVLSHQYMKEWDSPKEPAFPEALLVHFADDIDAKMNMYVTILEGAPDGAEFSDQNNIFRRKLLRKRSL
jgi:3'-5' exoribonuclease